MRPRPYEVAIVNAAIRRGARKAVAIPIAFVNPWLSGAIYVTVALIWLVPDPRIEKHLPELR